MTRKELPAQAINLQRAIDSPATCTSATVEALRVYLLPPRNPTLSTKYKTAAESLSKSKSAPKSKARRTGCKAPPAAAVLELSDTEEDDGQAQDKILLATEVINTALRALTSAIKKPPTQKRKGPLRRTSSGASFTNKSGTRSQLPLQPLCANRVSNVAGDKGHLRRSSSAASFDENLDGIRAQAECGRIAFSNLRLMQAKKLCSSMPQLQLESGMSALIGKLIHLGFEDLAVKELRILTKRLHSLLNPVSTQHTTKSAGTKADRDSSISQQETLATMLCFPTESACGQLVALIITTQLQILKLLALKKDRRLTKAALPHLRWNVPYSPANLIQRQIESEPPSARDRSSHQLTSFASSLSALFPVASSAKDPILHSSDCDLPADVGFEIQVLAMRVQRLSWKVTGHKPDPAREIFIPFRRSLSAFHQHCLLDKRTKYCTVKTAFELVAEHTNNIEAFQNSDLAMVYDLMAEIAQEDANYLEAISWINKVGKCIAEYDMTQARLCNLNCRLAVLHLRLCGSNPDELVLEALKTVSNGLLGSLQGSSVELDDLLLNVADLRRYTFSLFQAAHQPPSPDMTPISSGILGQCTEIILLCSKFVLRYLGGNPSEREHEKLRAREEKRRCLAAQFSNPIIESVAAVARSSAKTTKEDWANIDASLRDCLALALAIEKFHFDDLTTAKGKRASYPFVSLSNAYWFRFLYLKQDPKDAKRARECLRTSIDLIQGRPSSERIAGLLLIKLERYAQFCESIRDYKRAVEAYEAALDAQRNLGHLQIAAENARFRSLPNALDCNSDLGILSRSLAAYSRLAVKANKQGYNAKPYFDLEELGPDERGVLLEQQLISLLPISQDTALASIAFNALNALMKELLTLYTDDLYPVRRLRVFVRLLGLMPGTSKGYDDGLQALIRQPQYVPKELHLDRDLVAYVPHLSASQELLSIIHKGVFELEKVIEMLKKWSKMICDYPDWDSLQARVYDTSDWLSLLDFLGDYLDMKGVQLTRVAALHLSITLREASNLAQYSDLVGKLAELGLQYARLGYSGKAGAVFRKAQRYLEDTKVSADAALRWHLSYAEHILYLGDTKRCKDNLFKARKLYQDIIGQKGSQMTHAEDQKECSLTVGYAFYVHSLLAAAEGQIMEAMNFGRLGVKIYQRSWASLERVKKKSHKPTGADSIENEHDVLADSIAELSIAEHQSIKPCKPAQSAENGAAFWELAPRLFQGFINLVNVFAFHGLFQEVKYYLSQARAIAEAVKSNALIGQYKAFLGKCLNEGGNPHEGFVVLQDAEAILVDFPHDRCYIQLQLTMAEYHIDNGRQEQGLSALAKGKDTLRALMMNESLDNLSYQRSASESLDSQLAALTIQDVKPKREALNRVGQTKSKKKPTLKPNVKVTAAQPLREEIPAQDAIGLGRMKNAVLREQIHAAIIEGNIESALTLLDNAFTPEFEYGKVLQALVVCKIRFGQLLKQLVPDPIFCVLSESTIAYPSIKTGAERQQQKNNPCDPANVGASVSMRNQEAGGVASKKRPKSPLQCKFDISLLDQAQTTLHEAYKLAKTHSATSTIHQLTKTLGKILMLLSATSFCAPNRPISPYFMAYVLEAGRMLSIKRESTAVLIEHQLSPKKIDYDWPRDNAIHDSQYPRFPQTFDFSSFQADYIDIIPNSWNVLSLTLSETREEILICKIHAAQTPLILRIPLHRCNSMESEEEGFSFDEGKAELQEIIRLTNESTHGAQDLSRKGAKTEWWDARISLDARLRDLLSNIENIWLGGFRGIFAQEPENQRLLARLQQSLQMILDKYLPSRQKVGGRNQPSRLTFDQRIIELFVGLGSPSETNDIDEPLMDLLYFIVDILQFHGERNAYDEIDFDSIVVEATDALRQYHQAVYDEGTGRQRQHTILILDKHLHGFPWESLPCLKGQAVSRLPSFTCLRDRILLHRGRKASIDNLSSVGEGFCIDRNLGAYILNPGGDLKSTHSKFEEPLQRLTSWETVVGKEPSEAEMKGLLENQEILLYFGHGSGGQYIRSRTIKRLDKCAVALLMGCSSGTLTEAGDFESYGTPLNYMHAGSPAVLATLWDVTDKDIDRFSQSVLEDWGLFDKPKQPIPRSPVKKNAKQKGKSRANNVDDEKTGENSRFSLDEAVSRGRDSCILKYLNGAAPVVYGVPVFLT